MVIPKYAGKDEAHFLEVWGLTRMLAGYVAGLTGIRPKVRKSMEWDDDGYPTEGTLKEIAEWKGNNFRDFFAALKPVWRYADGPNWFGWTEEDAVSEVFDKPVHRYLLSTGGWSGNESLIEAMRENYVLWALTWWQERRGGHFIFEVAR